MTESRLGPGPEFDRIRDIARRLGTRASGLGDDCALVPAGTGTLALSTDASVDGVHFRREWLSAREIGWRACAAALSDLAAEAATPIGVLAALIVPERDDASLVAELMEGVGDAVASVGGAVLGGDLTRGETLALAITVIGRADYPVMRAGARPGDSVWVSGTLGGARAALDAWLAGETPSAEARAAFAHPAPRITAGVWLAAHGARAMLDISDGLGGDLRHLAAASGVELDIDLAAVPVHPAVAAAARRRSVPSETYAAEGGEDYELAVSLPLSFGPEEAARFREACGIVLTRIGDVRAGEGVRYRLGGRDVSLAGFDHFSL